MLLEMRSPVFIENGIEREPIKFKEGLNVILGNENGTNSIGKSSAMLAIDFVFGGNTYVQSDGVEHIGHHPIYFAFKFENQVYYFYRHTSNPNEIMLCSKEYIPTGEVWNKEKYTSWLKCKYEMDFSGLSFRATLSSFFRIYGKANTDELHPLKGLQGQGMEKSIDLLVKLYNYHGDIERLSEDQKEQDDKLKAFKGARRYKFVSDIVDGDRQYEDNLIQIKKLQQELDSMVVNQTTNITDSDLIKGKQKDRLLTQKIQLESSIQSKKRKKQLVDMSLECGLQPSEADLSGLLEFFPTVNLRKIYEVENYHKKLAGILSEQFMIEKNTIEQEIEELEKELIEINHQITELGYVGNLPREFLDMHSEIQGKIQILQTQNDSYLKLKTLQESKKTATERLQKGIEKILGAIELSINQKMKEFNDSLFYDIRKAPQLKFNSYKSYSFETPDDRGTGSNYKGMVIYDLAVLNTSALPAIAHDSLILKNIGDQTVDGIMKVYEKSKKQIFVSFDRQSSYQQDTQRILNENKILELSDNGGEFYGQSWNKE